MDLLIDDLASTGLYSRIDSTIFEICVGDYSPLRPSAQAPPRASASLPARRSVNDFMKGAIKLDNAGHVLTNLQMETSVPGVFAVGDVRQYSDRQFTNAVGDGVSAALAAYRYLNEG